MNYKEFDANGYVFLKNQLTDAELLKSYRQSIADFIEAGGTSICLDHSNDALVEYRKLSSFEDRMTFIFGLTRGSVFDWIDPIQNMYRSTFKIFHDLPHFRFAELFRFQTEPAILDAVESVIGDEITCTPNLHINIKFSPQQFVDAEKISTAFNGLPLWINEENVDFGKKVTGDFAYGRTPWHKDAMAGYADAFDSNICTVWIPLTKATATNSCLSVIPGSHKLDIRELPGVDGFWPHAKQILDDQAKIIEADTGDILVFHNRLLHCSTTNESDQLRIAINFRYSRTGDAAGRPYLPGFIARSELHPEKVLNNPFLWVSMWNRALNNAYSNLLPLEISRKVDAVRAKKMTQRWNTKFPRCDDWLKLDSFSLEG